jgi:hypothetical protein
MLSVCVSGGPFSIHLSVLSNFYLPTPSFQLLVDLLGLFSDLLTDFPLFVLKLAPPNTLYTQRGSDQNRGNDVFFLSNILLCYSITTKTVVIIYIVMLSVTKADPVVLWLESLMISY